MSLFFDGEWFDARLAERGLDRGALAECAGLERGELHRLFINERSATTAELNAFAKLLGVDLLEVTLRSGISERAPAAEGDASARIESIEARLNAIDEWLNELEQSAKQKRA
ncbi:MAG: helix-turn-helix transcriptional regulator [Terricaulis sp.]